jgi:hypothetical protein
MNYQVFYVSSAIQERSRRRIVITFNRVSEVREADFETGHSMLSPSPKTILNGVRPGNGRPYTQQLTLEQLIVADAQTTVVEKGLTFWHF